MVVMQSIAVSRSFTSTKKLYDALAATSLIWDSGHQNDTLTRKESLEQFFTNYQMDISSALQRGRETTMFWGLSGLPTLVVRLVSCPSR